MIPPAIQAPRILLVRYGAMGDITHALPAAAALRRAWPRARIDWLAESRWAPLLDAGPGGVLSEVIAVDTFRLRRELASRHSWREVRTLRQRLRENRYDVAVDLQGAIKSALSCRLSGAPQVFGFASPWLRESLAGLLHSTRVRAGARHIVEAYLEMASRLVRSLGGPDERHPAEFPLPAGDASALPAGLLSENFAVMCPGAGWPAKQWPAAAFAGLADALASRHGLATVLNCGPGEQELAAQVQRRCRQARPAAFSGSIPTMIALLRRARLMVGPDSGPLHLAAALGVPTLGIFGPTDPERNGPYGPAVRSLRAEGARTSYRHDDPPDGSMDAISTEMALAAAEDLLARQPLR